MNISYLLVAGESELLDNDVLSLTSSDPEASSLLASSQDEQDEAIEIEDVSEHSQPACPDMTSSWTLCLAARKDWICCGSVKSARRSLVAASMNASCPNITVQFVRVFPFSQIYTLSCGDLGQSHILHTSIVHRQTMLMWRGWRNMVMRRCLRLKRCWPAISR